jgi:hypothetical protein
MKPCFVMYILVSYPWSVGKTFMITAVWTERSALSAPLQVTKELFDISIAIFIYIEFLFWMNNWLYFSIVCVYSNQFYILYRNRPLMKRRTKTQ